jgi:hypothetical protein
MAQEDFWDERQRLAQLYSEKWDDELRVLAEDYADLTETAQQALRDEMKKRGLGDPSTPPPVVVPALPANPTRDTPDLDDFDADSEGAEEPSEDEPEHEYTWKTPLCDCETQEQAWQLREVLRRNGIESWIEGGNRYTWDLGRARILVAADQLEQARTLAAQPIPQDVVDEWNAQQNDPDVFEAPHCPSCGAEDPVLASVEPVNTWQCEVCGREWSDEAGGKEK